MYIVKTKRVLISSLGLKISEEKYLIEIKDFYFIRSRRVKIKINEKYYYSIPLFTHERRIIL